jgi:hypothetical protein
MRLGTVVARIAAGRPMPTIAWFYGIMIQTFYNDHEPPGPDADE